MKRKRLICVMLAIALLAFCVPSRAAGDGFIVQNGVLTKYTGSGSTVTIPDGVTSIGESAFHERTNLTSVTIPDGVTSIGDYAFSNCWHLRNVVIPGSVTYIGEGAFEYCDLTSVTIPDGVTSIMDNTFDHNINLTSVIIPDSVTSIGIGAFDFCGSLTNITLPDGLTSIGDYAFYKCKLKSVTIPAGVKSIGKCAFLWCQFTNLTIPDGVTSIEDGAFNGCTDLTDMTIPASVTSIGEYAFEDCDSLNDVYYTGSEAQWYRIQGLSEAKIRPQAKIHFDAALPAPSADPSTTPTAAPSEQPIASPEAPSVELRPTAIPSSVKVEPIAVSGTDGSVLTGIPIGRTGAQPTTAGIVKSWISIPASTPANSKVEVLSPDGKPVANDAPVGTGMLVAVVAPSGAIVSSSSICIRGDVLGTGEMSLSQLVRMATAFTGSKPLTGVYAEAADLNGDGSVTLTDLVSEASLYLGNAASGEQSASGSQNLFAQMPQHYILRGYQCGKWGLGLDIADDGSFVGYLHSPTGKDRENGEVVSLVNQFAEFRGHFGEPVARDDHSYTLPITDFAFVQGGDIYVPGDTYSTPRRGERISTESELAARGSDVLDLAPLRGSMTLYLEGSTVSEIEQAWVPHSFAEFKSLTESVLNSLYPENGHGAVLMHNGYVLTRDDGPAGNVYDFFG